MIYNSPPTTIPEQLQKLKARGMTVENPQKAEQFLQSVSYYRFTGYALHFEIFENRKRTHKFKKETSFDRVVSLYEFDSSLRKLLFSAIEFIEVAFRTQLCLQLALNTKNSHWFLNKSLFQSRFDHVKFIEECKNETARSREVFIENYKQKYHVPELPASWMLIEIVSFGTWSRLYSSLRDKSSKRGVAKLFNLSPFILESWIHSLTVIRNLCAHHARIWNRTLTIKPKLTRRMEDHYPPNSKERKRIVLILDIIFELLKPLGKDELFIRDLNNLLKEHSDVPVSSMGLKNRVIDMGEGVGA